MNFIKIIQDKIRKRLFNLWWLRFDLKYLYKIRCYFSPCHKKIRKSIPRNWTDSDELMRIINFAIITEFFEDEIGGFDKIQKLIDFNRKTKERSYNSDGWLNFYRWLKKAYNYIIKIRPRLEEKMNAAYPDLGPCPLDEINNRKFNFEQKYSEVNRFQKLIEEKDTNVLIEFVKFRQYFWT